MSPVSARGSTPTATQDARSGGAADRLRVRLWSLTVLLVVGGVATLAVRAHDMAQDQSAARAAAGGAARHVTTPVDYDTVPADGGDHHPVWWDCGTYDRPVPDEHAVHSLEHGAVWLTYRGDVGDDVVEALEDLADRSFLLLSPRDDQTSPVMATAWGEQLAQPTLDVAELAAFVEEHRLSPRAPEPGASCSDGTTEDLVRRDRDERGR